MRAIPFPFWQPKSVMIGSDSKLIFIIVILILLLMFMFVMPAPAQEVTSSAPSREAVNPSDLDPVRITQLRVDAPLRRELRGRDTEEFFLGGTV